jgi:hypothetical protein
LGGTLTGKLFLAPSTTLAAGVNCGVGSTPSTPVNGDIWCTSSGAFIQVNGSTIGPIGAGIVGTLAVTSGGTGQASFTANQPLIGNGASAVAQGTRSGNTTTFATTTGVMTSGNCVSIDASGNLVAAGGACTTGGGGGTVTAATIGQLAIYAGTTTSVGGLTSCNNGYIGTSGGGVNSCNTSVNTTLSATITALGTIATGTWQGTVVSSTFGGTGINNGGRTLTVAGNFATAGANALTLTTTAPTNVTLPTTGTLMNQVGTSGGIPYYSSGTSIASSGALTANLPVFGGGAGSSPIVGTRSGNTTQVVTTTGAQTSGNCVSIDASGNHIANGSACAASSWVLLNTLTASNSTALQDTTSFTGTYRNYALIFTKLIAATPSASAICQIQVHSGGIYQSSTYVSTNSLGGTPNQYIACIPNLAGANSMGDPGTNGIVYVANPSAGKPVWTGLLSATAGSVGTPNPAMVQFTGWWNNATAVDGFQFFYGTAAGTPTTNGIGSGVIEVWGIP